MTPRRHVLRKQQKAEPSTIWHEWLVGVEFGFLTAVSTLLGIWNPPLDGSAGVLVPGFLGIDLYLTQLRNWLRRIGYQAFYSGIHMNADCPNPLIRRHLTESIQQACKEQPAERFI
jgi:triacylglycerol lipase